MRVNRVSTLVKTLIVRIPIFRVLHPIRSSL